MITKIVKTREEIVQAIENTNSLGEAAKSLNMTYQTFCRRAKEFNLHNSGKNQGLKGQSKPWPETRKKLTLDDILSNKAFETSSKFKQRLFNAKIKINKCDECGIESWNGKPLVCHLDHINGNSHDNRLENLRILCPNCHSQTETYCRGQGKNKENGSVA